MDIIGPRTSYISRLYNNPPLGSRGTKRVKIHAVVCIMLDGRVVFHDISPYLKNGKQYGRCKDGHISRRFIKQNKIWKEIL